MTKPVLLILHLTLCVCAYPDYDSGRHFDAGNAETVDIINNPGPVLPDGDYWKSNQRGFLLSVSAVNPNAETGNPIGHSFPLDAEDMGPGLDESTEGSLSATKSASAEMADQPASSKTTDLTAPNTAKKSSDDSNLPVAIPINNESTDKDDAVTEGEPATNGLNKTSNDTSEKVCCNLSALQGQLNNILIFVIFIAVVVVILLFLQLCFAYCTIRTLRIMADNPEDAFDGGNRYNNRPSILKPIQNEKGKDTNKKVTIAGKNDERTPLLQESDDEESDQESGTNARNPPNKNKEDSGKDKEEIELKPVSPTNEVEADKPAPPTPAVDEAKLAEDEPKTNGVTTPTTTTPPNETETDKPEDISTFLTEV